MELSYIAGAGAGAGIRPFTLDECVLSGSGATNISLPIQADVIITATIPAASIPPVAF